MYEYEPYRAPVSGTHLSNVFQWKISTKLVRVLYAFLQPRFKNVNYFRKAVSSCYSINHKANLDYCYFFYITSNIVEK